jgi:hypothetical protein
MVLIAIGKPVSATYIPIDIPMGRRLRPVWGGKALPNGLWYPLPGEGFVKEHGHADFVRDHCAKNPEPINIPNWLDDDMFRYAMSLLMVD